MKCMVTETRWERVLLHLVLKTGVSDWFEAFLEEERSGTRFPLQTEPRRADDPENLHRFFVNVTNPGSRRCLADGSYRVILVRDGRVTCEAACACKIQNAGKSFPFNKWNDCYCISITGDPFRIRVRTNYVNSKQRLRKQVLTGALTGLYRIFHTVYHAGKNRRKKTVLFLSGQSVLPGSNLTAVRDRIRQRGLSDENGKFRIVESYRDRNCGRKELFAAVRCIASADFIFVDDHEPLLDYLLLDTHTVLTQLWHAGVGFKSSGYSRFGCPGGPAPFMCHRQYTWGVVSSNAVIPIFSEIWGINDDQVLPLGLPRMDRYLDPEHRALKEAELKERFPMIRGKKVILFAPTYRGSGKADAAYPYEKIDFDLFYDTLGTDSVVLFRMHPWVKKAVPIPERMKDRMADAAGVPDINDLFYVTDLLITDYSSNICEYSLMDRPMLFYAFDEEEYGQQRGFHRDYETFAPGRVCRSFPELMEAYRLGDFEREKAQRYVREQFDRRDSGASDRVIDRILCGKV